MILVDTNVLIDLRDCDARWEPWSARAVAIARLDDTVMTSTITIGELASRGGDLVDLQDLCATCGVQPLPLCVEAGYRAGKAQREYRQRGGKRDKLLADFLIGGQASAIGAQLLTRDPRVYRTYFPELPLITPETHP